MSINIKEINGYHVMLGVVIGAGGVVAGMQLISLASKKKKLQAKNNENAKNRRHQNFRTIYEAHIPTLTHSQGIVMIEIKFQCAVYTWKRIFRCRFVVSLNY